MIAGIALLVWIVGGTLYFWLVMLNRPKNHRGYWYDWPLCSGVLAVAYLIGAWDKLTRRKK